MDKNKIASRYSEAVSRVNRDKEIYSMYAMDKMNWREIMQKSGLSRNTVYRILRTFEAEHRQLAEQMKKKVTDITPEDYRKLLAEVNSLKAELKKEKLRADFYEEMVAFGEEVYGMDLKKAGTK